MALQIVPCTWQEACIFIGIHHRHHRHPPAGYRFCVAVAESNKVVGVATVGIPVARHLDDGWTLEVNRTCTDGTRNANSMLYGACWRAARAIGYRKLITYTLPEEGGASLRASGFKVIAERCGGGTWNRPNCGRPRVDKHPTQQKIRWQKTD